MAAIRRYVKKMFSISASRRFWLCVLGEVETKGDVHQIWLLRTRNSVDHEDPKMLIVSAFHGEEKAGPYSILKWMKNCDQNILKKVDLSFIPIVNPIGFKRNTRYNTLGEKTNCGFCHPENKESPSREGQILINNIDLLRPLAEDGFLSLHEDISAKEFYLYTFDESKKSGEFTIGMRESLQKFFPKALDGVRVIVDTGVGPFVKDGIINHHKLHDGSFEDWLHHLGVPRIVVTETPGTYQLRRRINAGVYAINKFINLNLELRNRKQSEE